MTTEKVAAPPEVPMTEREVYEQQVWEALKPTVFRHWTVFEPVEDPRVDEENAAHQLATHDARVKAGCRWVGPEDPTITMFGYYPRCKCAVCEEEEGG